MYIALTILSILVVIFIILMIIYSSKIFVKNIWVCDDKLTLNKVDGKCIKIVYFSDIHIGSELKKNKLNKIISKLNDLNGDAYIFGGDLNGSHVNKYYSLDDIKKCFEPLANKNSFAIRGNHEFKKDGQDINLKLKNFDSIGFKNLVNEEAIIIKDDKKIKIYGMDDCMLSDYKLNEKKYDLIFAHEPDIYDELKVKGIMIAGHAHNGQIHIPFLPYYKPKLAKKYTYGIYDDSLYVSSGLGFSIFKIRLFTKREIVVINYKI